uniref:Putative secreted protein n=1 Tax=Anopheles triannulatus TaxID=58253 RepID=A0A2M4B3R3_9DIPT
MIFLRTAAGPLLLWPWLFCSIVSSFCSPLTLKQLLPVNITDGGRDKASSKKCQRSLQHHQKTRAAQQTRGKQR